MHFLPWMREARAAGSPNCKQPVMSAHSQHPGFVHAPAASTSMLLNSRGINAVGGPLSAATVGWQRVRSWCCQRAGGAVELN